MQTEAVFKNIAYRISQEIKKAEDSIYIAVAWLTSQTLFNSLVFRARDGVKVRLLISDDHINEQSQVDYSRLNIGDSAVYFVGNGRSKLMHNKFCVIDTDVVITGSYNWSNKAKTNHENIVITSGDTDLAVNFINEFNRIKNIYYKIVEPTDYIAVEDSIDKIIKRLEILKNYIELEEPDEINRITRRLRLNASNKEVMEIVQELDKRNYSVGLDKCLAYIQKYSQVTIWNDPEIGALKLEIKVLENQLNAFDNERIELEKVILDFNHRYTIELGDVISEILKLRRLKFKNDKAKYKEAKEDEEKFNKQFTEEKEKVVFELNEEQKKELKSKFRKASILCHPDKVSDEQKETAKEVFINLKQAYDSNDLEKVSEILSELESGNYYTTKSQSIDEKELLKREIEKLKKQIIEIQNRIVEIRGSNTFREIEEIDNREDYFEKIRLELESELKRLRNEVL